MSPVIRSHAPALPRPGAPGRLAGFVTALSVTALVAALNLGAWTALNPALDLPDWDGPVAGVAYSGLRNVRWKYPAASASRPVWQRNQP